jgi:hypothetical protein
VVLNKAWLKTAAQKITFEVMVVHVNCSLYKFENFVSMLAMVLNSKRTEPRSAAASRGKEPAHAKTETSATLDGFNAREHANFNLCLNLICLNAPSLVLL